jgi:hypothetical protein
MTPLNFGPAPQSSLSKARAVVEELNSRSEAPVPLDVLELIMDKHGF